MKGSTVKIQMASRDDLFGGVVTQAAGDQIQEIPLAELHPFKDYPFHVIDDEKMQEMSESVAQYGLLVPGIVRPRPEGGYEIVAGHQRKRACELAGKETMPVIVREMDNDEATIIMVDSNLQREKILPSEKGFAYRMKLEAIHMPTVHFKTAYRANYRHIYMKNLMVAVSAVLRDRLQAHTLQHRQLADNVETVRKPDGVLPALYGYGPISDLIERKRPAL